MTLSEILRQAVATFRAHKMRTFLTMFGLVWGRSERNLPMRKSLTLFATAAGLCLGASAVQAMPVSAGSVRDAAQANDLVEKAAVYVVDGRRYCFYFNGWHGPGWYRCGFAWRA